MIGNDIVDLIEARLSSNWQRRGFLQKVFGPAEQEMIHAAEDPFLTVWRLWSMKESAYKFYLQKHPNALRGFYPAKIKCELLSPELGSVNVQGVELNTKTITHSSYLFSTAFSDLSISTEHEIFYLPETTYQYQSSFTRDKILDYLSEKKQLDKNKLVIKKSKKGVPLFFYKTKLLPIACSLTHHGNYGGFSISLD